MSWIVLVLLSTLLPFLAADPTTDVPAVYASDGLLVVEGVNDVMLIAGSGSTSLTDILATQTGLATTQSNLLTTQSNLTIAQANLQSTQSQLTATQSQLTATQSQLTATVSRITVDESSLALTQAALSTAQAALSTTTATLTATQSRVSTLENSMALVLASLSLVNPPAATNIVNVVQLSNSLSSNTNSINKIVNAITSTPSTPSVDSLYSSASLNNAINTKAAQTDLQSIVNTLSPTSAITNMINVPTLQATINTQSGSISKLVAAASTLPSPGNENSLWSITTLANRLTSDEATISSQGNTITSQGSSITTLNTGLASAQNSIAAQQVLITGLTTRASNDESTISSQGTTINSLSTSLTSAQSSITALMSRLTTDESSITSQGSSITSLTTRLTTDETTIATQGTSISSLSTRLTTDESTIASQTASINSLTTTTNTLTASTNSQGSSLTALSSRLTTDESSITAQGNSISSVSSRLTTDEGTLTSHGSSITSLMSTLTSVQGTVTGHTSSITTINTVAIPGLQSSATWLAAPIGCKYQEQYYSLLYSTCVPLIGFSAARGFYDWRSLPTSWTDMYERIVYFTKYSSTSILEINYMDSIGFLLNAQNTPVAQWQLLINDIPYSRSHEAHSDLNAPGTWRIVPTDMQFNVAGLASGRHTIKMQILQWYTGASQLLSGWPDEQNENSLAVREVQSSLSALTYITADIRIYGATWQSVAYRTISYTKSSASTDLWVTLSDNLGINQQCQGDAGGWRLLVDGTPLWGQLIIYAHYSGWWIMPYTATWFVSGLATGTHNFIVQAISYGCAEETLNGWPAGSANTAMFVEEKARGNAAIVTAMPDSRINVSPVNTWVSIAGRQVVHTKQLTSSIVRVTYMDNFGFYGNGGATTACLWRLLVDGSEADARYHWSHSTTYVGWRIFLTKAFWYPTVAPGAHTYVLQFYLAGGASYCLNGYPQPVHNYIYVEEIETPVTGH